MRTLFLLLLLLPFGLNAVVPSAQQVDIKETESDSDFFVGKGLADSKDYKGDPLKALLKAREDARAELALNVQSVIRSKFSEKISVVGGKTVEEFTSESSAESKVALRNLAYREYVDYPSEGQVTVLAFITKSDYRRMLAGLDLRVFHPENGVSLDVVYREFEGLNKLLDASAKAQAAATPNPTYNNLGKATIGPFSPYPTLGLEAHWFELYADFSYTHGDIGLFDYDWAQSKDYHNSVHSLNIFQFGLGWDYIPKEWRLQPFFPLRVKSAWMELRSDSASASAQYTAWLFGASVGAGLRFWVNDKFSLEAVSAWDQGLNQAELSGSQGPILLGIGERAPAVDMSGYEMTLRIRYSGF